MKRYLALFILSLPPQVDAECMGRGYRSAAGEPEYVLESCGSAKEYFSTLEIDPEVLARILVSTSDVDKAVLIKPANESARSVMWGYDQDYWHYSGACEKLLLNTEVRIVRAEGHCSDLGPTKFGYLGDFTIVKVRKASFWLWF